jgi:hypothetical protein
VADSAVHLSAVAFGGPISAVGSSVLVASHFDLAWGFGASDHYKGTSKN